MTGLDWTEQAWAELPLVAILRGIMPAEVSAVGQALLAADWRIIEIPLNSPDALHSIDLLRQQAPLACIGAGTVLRLEDVDAVLAAGADLVVAPNFNPQVVSRARSLGMAVMPGVATPSEAFAAHQAGATALKVFPAEAVTAAALRAWRAVMPDAMRLLPVGGIGPDNMGAYRRAGADGFGLGSSLYRAGDAAVSVGERAGACLRAWGVTHQGTLPRAR